MRKADGDFLIVVASSYRANPGNDHLRDSFDIGDKCLSRHGCKRMLLRGATGEKVVR